MRKRLLLIGVIILIIGVAFSVAGFVGEHNLVPISSQTMTQTSSGIWASSSLNVKSGSVLEVTSSSNSTYLVNTSDAGQVDASNIAKYEIHPLTTTTADSLHILEYDNISGSFTVVSTSSSKPTVTTTLIANIGMVAVLGLLLIIGVVLAIAGFIIAIIGAVLKPKNPPVNETYGFNQ